MHIVIIGDTFPPMKTSGAFMLKDLADEFITQGDTVSVIIPSQSQDDLSIENVQGGLNLFQVKAFKTKDVSYVRRLFGEFANPYLMWSRLNRCNSFINSTVDLVVWYSPSIFWGPLVSRIKKRWGCPSYLILRDIFPDWAIHLGLISKFNPISYLLKLISRFQYQQANVIGVQSPNNRLYLAQNYPALTPKVSVLWNWMRKQELQEKCSIRIAETRLAGKSIFVYTGNIGVAQGVEVFLRIIKAFQNYDNIGFLFVGRGHEMIQLQQKVADDSLKNILFFPEIPSDQINDLYAQCCAGIIALDGRHKTHNIPGKFVSYMHAGLPVFGLVNPGNDLIQLVNDHHLGFIGNVSDPDDLSEVANKFINLHINQLSVHKRCKELGNNLFDSKRAVREIKAIAL
jgi:glycosyltransferase involved in cell wall biosynthesis